MQHLSAVFLDDGLGDQAPARFLERRKVLAKTLSSPLVLAGMNRDASHLGAWVQADQAIIQEPLFLALTGINQLGSALVILPGQPHQEILYLPKPNPQKAFWDGVQLTVANGHSTGFTDIRPISQLSGDLRQLANTHAGLTTAWQASSKNKPFKDESYRFYQTLKAQVKPYPVAQLGKAQWDRLCLDAADQANIQTANTVSAQALKTLLSKLQTFETETQVAGHLKGELLSRSAYGESFPAIVAGGANATILHYRKNDEPLPPKGLLLLDFGAKWYGLHADISRTVPVSGRFNPLQRLVYTLVLQAQAAVEASAKPGISIAELNHIAWSTLNTLLDTHIRKAGGKIHTVYQQQPHNVSHLIGHQIHDGDPFREYRSQPLKAGMVISNEPGFYGRVQLEIEGVAYDEELGIRIEDGLLITPTGCKNLSVEAPKDPDELEALIQG
ncbi:MAG: aminopeptidase P N-terminal domain-containing protein [Candidatus Margulisiibacteriota bacterium]